MNQTQATVDRMVRDHFGRLVAYVARRTHDPSSAEDALSEAMARALVRWPTEGIPENPDAWLLRTAQNLLVDKSRRERRLIQLDEAIQEGLAATAASDVPDERLALMFACAHPAIHPADRAPLILQLVLGLPSSLIAKAYVVPAATMAQRLVRAKEKIRLAKIPFTVSEPSEERIPNILQAVYAAYEQGRESPELEAEPGHSLIEDAVWLARLISQLLPGDPEAQGLLSLLLFVESRRGSAMVNGIYIPLDRQAVGDWNHELRREADQILWQARSAQRFGRFQIEAAIQSAHMARRCEGVDTRTAIVELYDVLIRLAPSLGASVGRAMAIAEASGAEKGMVALEEVHDAKFDYQPYWAALAELQLRLGQNPDAAANRAIGMASNSAVVQFLRQRFMPDQAVP